jgi:hypothetical protein
MKFHFHTLVIYDEIPVYYNVHQYDDHYFVEILENPKNLPFARDFNLKLLDGNWYSSEILSRDQAERIGEEIITFLK